MSMIYGLLIFIGLNAILALWVYVDCKRYNSPKVIWPVLTLISGLIGWLIYLIKRLDRTEKVNAYGN
jgi:hypothetical protein